MPESLSFVPDDTEPCERFQLRGPVGEGSFGMVYRAWDHILQTEVALKFFHPDQHPDIDDLRREVAIAHKLHHPNFVRVHDVVAYEGIPCISMEWVTGETLRKKLSVHGALTPDEVATLGIALADAIAVAHDHNICHCDIKPDNIIVDGDQFRLIDFGLAFSLTSPTRHRDPRGTQLYMSPEQRQCRPLDHRTDIYSIGVLLFEAAVGRQLTLQELASESEALRVDLRRLPSTLRRVIVRCIHVRPDDRFDNARDIALALRKQNSTIWSVRNRANVRALSWRNKALSVIAALLALCVTAMCVAVGISATSPTIMILPVAAPPALEAHATALYENLWEAVGAAMGQTIAMIPPGKNISLTGRWTEKANVIIKIELLSDTACRLTTTRRWARVFHWSYSDVIRAQRDKFLAGNLSNALARRGVLILRQTRDEQNNLPQHWASFAQATHNIIWYSRDEQKLKQSVDVFAQIISHSAQCQVCYLRRAQAEVQLYLLSRDDQYRVNSRADINQALLLAKSPDVWILGASLYLQLNDRESMEKTLQNPQYKLSTSQQGLKLEGMAMAQDGIYDNAIVYLRKALSQNPLDINTVNNLGIAQISAGRYNDAIQSFEHILLLTPNSYAALNNVSLAYMRTGQMSQAVGALESVVNSNPTAESWSNLGMALVYSGKPCLIALPYFEKAAALAPNTEEVIGYLAHAYRWCGMQAQARKSYTRAIALASRQLTGSAPAQMYVNAAVYAAALGDSEKFETYLRLARQHSTPADYDLEYEAAIGFALLGDERRVCERVGQLARVGYSRAFLEHNPDLSQYRYAWDH
jgi:tetratricopeptide (TPR) repeat protein